MESTEKRKFILIFVICPYLKRKVTLYDKTWRHKISVEHSIVADRSDLVKKILESSLDSTVNVYQKKRDIDSIAIYKKCPHLGPYYEYICITVKFLNRGEAVMTSCYGKNDGPPLDMEEYDGH